MLITVSGMVGSGKSTAVRQVADILGAAGVGCRVHRFRALRLLPFRSGATPVRKDRVEAASERVRWAGFRPERLKALKACGYAARIIAFRMFGVGGKSSDWNILDRYFYDNLVHYELRTAPEKFYAAVLERLIPAPDLAILLVASETTLLRRRPDYSSEYIREAALGYERLHREVPGLVRVSTDADPDATNEIQRLVRELLENRQAAGAAVVRRRVS